MKKEYPEIMGTIPIINIIENPKLKNVCNDYEEDSLYSNEFEVIYDNVKNQVPNAEEIEKTLYDIINKQSAENSSNISNSLAAAKLYTDLEVSALNKKIEDVSDNIIWTINDVSKHTMSYINDVKYNSEMNLLKSLILMK